MVYVKLREHKFCIRLTCLNGNGVSIKIGQNTNFFIVFSNRISNISRLCEFEHHQCVKFVHITFELISNKEFCLDL